MLQHPLSLPPPPPLLLPEADGPAGTYTQGCKIQEWILRLFTGEKMSLLTPRAELDLTLCLLLCQGNSTPAFRRRCHLP